MSEVWEALFSITLLAGMVRIATPVLLAASGELVTERSGVMNLGIEGMMLTGAFAGFMTAHETGSLWLGVLGAVVASGLPALLMAFMCVTLRLDQVVSGLAINLLASGLTFYFFRVSFQEAGDQNLPNVATFSPVEIPGLSSIPFSATCSSRSRRSRTSPCSWFRDRLVPIPHPHGAWRSGSWARTRGPATCAACTSRLSATPR